MKLFRLWLWLVLAQTAPLSGAEPDYLIDWFAVVDGGGGFSSGGGFTLGGTIGQPAPFTSSGGGFVLHGGFWNEALEEGPSLHIQFEGSEIVVYWPASCTRAGYVLTWTGFVPCAPKDWTLLPPPYQERGSDNIWRMLHSPGNFFFRLLRPAAAPNQALVAESTMRAP